MAIGRKPPGAERTNKTKANIKRFRADRWVRRSGLLVDPISGADASGCRQGTEQQVGQANGAPFAGTGAHLQPDRSASCIGSQALQPGDRVPKALLDRVVEAVELGMGLEQGIDLRAVDAWLGPSLLFQEFDPTLKTGEHTVMLGPNGAGKSALIQLLSREI